MSFGAFRELLLGVQRPARYVGGEPGAVLKDPAAVEVRFALCFPDAYEIGMSHLGLRILYSRLNRDPRVWCERAFAPLPDMERAMRAAGMALATLESGTPLDRLDVLGFSLQHELGYTNVLQMLELGGVPLRAADRRLDHPLVLAGGPAAFHAEPLAPFVDAFAIGDGEDLAAEVALLWTTARRDSRDRDEALRELARHPSVYVPGLATLELDAASGRLVVVSGAEGELPPLACAARIADLDEHPFPIDGPVPLTEVVFDRAAVEIARGCSGGCRFCQAGMIYRPVRERSVDAILGCLLGQIRHGGYDEASLASLSTADYSQLEPLVQGAAELLAERDVALSVSSLRAHGVSAELSAALERVRTTSLTLAPEAGTQRLRDVINKNVDEEAIFRGASAAITRSRRRLKLYFMVGLPTETEADVRAIAELASRLQSSLQVGRGTRAGLTVSLSTFVPKPHTPLQWCASIGKGEVLERQALLRGLLAPRRIELRPHDVRLSMLEALLCRADRSAGDLLEHAYRQGARFDGWDDLFDEPAWERALDLWGGDPGALRAEIPLESRLPWDHLAVGPSRAYLLREHRRALAGRETAPCLRPGPDGSMVCHGCGLDCDLELQASRLARSGSASPTAPAGARTAAAAATPVETSRYRLVFSKTGRLELLGHLDAMRALSRLLRRAGVRVAYSRGFHPKPRLGLAAPLPVGVAGLAEVADMVLEGEPEPGALLERLRTLAPEGLRPLSLRHLEPGEPGCARATAAADLVLASRQMPAAIGQALETLLDSGRLVVGRAKGRQVEVRPSLLALGPCEDEGLLRGLGIEDPALRASIALGAGPSLRPAELLRLLGVEDPAPRIVRVALLTTPLPTRLT